MVYQNIESSSVIRSDHGVWRSWHSSKSTVSETASFRERRKRNLLNGAIFDDLEWPLTPVEKVTRGSSVKLHCKRCNAIRLTRLSYIASHGFVSISCFCWIFDHLWPFCPTAAFFELLWIFGLSVFVFFDCSCFTFLHFTLSISVSRS